MRLQFKYVSVYFDQPQRLAGSPYDEASVAQLWGIQARPDDASQFPSPDSELALYTRAEEAEPPGHGCVTDGE
jgi:hypothetical protein